METQVINRLKLACHRFPATHCPALCKCFPFLFPSGEAEKEERLPLLAKAIVKDDGFHEILLILCDGSPSLVPYPHARLSEIFNLFLFSSLGHPFSKSEGV
jgi:hypothetical protein